MTGPDLTARPWSERLIAATGWIGEHPVDREDVAHLLVYPVAPGIGAEMRAAALLLGLRGALAGPPVRVPPDVARLTVAGGWVRLAAAGATALERPVSRDWTVAAAGRGLVMVTLGEDAYSGQPGDLDGYLSVGRGLHMGLLIITGLL